MGSSSVSDVRRALADEQMPVAPVVDWHGRFEGTMSAAALTCAAPGGEVRRYLLDSYHRELRRHGAAAGDLEPAPTRNGAGSAA